MCWSRSTRDHLPLYRQSEIYEREGVELDRSTLADWVGGASRTLEPLVDALRQYVLDADKLHGDDIPGSGAGSRATAKPRRAGCGLMSVTIGRRAARSAPAVWFAYSPDRKSEHPANHLETFRGNAASGWICRIQSALRKGRHRRSGLLGALSGHTVLSGAVAQKCL